MFAQCVDSETSYFMAVSDIENVEEDHRQIKVYIRNIGTISIDLVIIGNVKFTVSTIGKLREFITH